ncbi:MAG TPA: GNAT family N-acetyltransferase [Polyangiaceae bacterium]|nr:GNAT family N-acetyltransferase [Polyangiaceae bacterium]
MSTHDAALLELSDLNLAEAHREQVRFALGYRIEEHEDALLLASATRYPAGPFNSLLPLGQGVNDAVPLLDRARQWYGALNRGFTIYARQHRDRALVALWEREGYARVGEPVGMVLSQAPDAHALSTNVSIRTLQGAERAADVVEISAAAYESMGLPGDMTRKMFAMPERWLTPHWLVQVVYEGEQPVAGAMLLFSHGIAGVYWVGTRPEARGRGRADAVMRSICRHAFELGTRLVVLQASPMGEPVYRRMGFREITRYPWYLVPKEPLG